jgi:hypothetical protein
MLLCPYDETKGGLNLRGSEMPHRTVATNNPPVLQVCSVEPENRKSYRQVSVELRLDNEI